MLICWLRNYEIKTTRLAADPADAEDAGAALESQAVDDAAADPESPAAETSAPRPAASMADVLALQGLASAAENRDGYELALFKHWVDADGGGCDIRKEVLIAEAVQPTGRGAGWPTRSLPGSCEMGRNVSSSMQDTPNVYVLSTGHVEDDVGELSERPTLQIRYF